MAGREPAMTRPAASELMSASKMAMVFTERPPSSGSMSGGNADLLIIDSSVVACLSAPRRDIYD
jgi:hypothetical protein